MKYFCLQIVFLFIICHNGNGQSSFDSLELYNAPGKSIVKMEIIGDSIQLKNNTRCLEKSELIQLMNLQNKKFDNEKAENYTPKKSMHCFPMKIVERQEGVNEMIIIAHYRDSLYFGFIIKSLPDFYKMIPISSSGNLEEVKQELNKPIKDPFYFPYFTMQQIKKIQSWKQMTEIDEADCITLYEWSKNNIERLTLKVQAVPYPFRSVYGTWEFNNIAFIGLLENRIDPFDIRAESENVSNFCDEFIKE